MAKMSSSGQVHNEMFSFKTHLWHCSGADTVYEGTFEDLALLQKTNEEKGTFQHRVKEEFYVITH